MHDRGDSDERKYSNVIIDKLAISLTSCFLAINPPFVHGNSIELLF